MNAIVILKRLKEIAESDNGASKGESMGNGPHPWSWIKQGEFCSGGRLEMSDADASQALTQLVRTGRVLIQVRKDDLYLQLPDSSSETIHCLTNKQMRKVVRAIEKGDDWPKFTDDPRVNHAVDCVVNDPGGEPEFDETYAHEIEAAKRMKL